MGDQGDGGATIHRAGVESPPWANEWRRARVGLATRQRRGWRPGGWGSVARAARAGRGEAGPGVGPADRGLRARARTGRRAAVGPGGQHGPHHHHPGKRSRAAAVPGPPHPAPLTSGAAAEQHGGGEGQQEQQQQAGEESHGAAGQRPQRVRSGSRRLGR